MGDLFGGAGIGGVLGCGLALLALLSSLRAEATVDPAIRSLRLFARMFIAGQAVLGLVVVALAVTYGGPSSQVFGFVGAIAIGVGAFGVRLAAGPFDRATIDGDVVRARARALLGMMFAEAVAVLGAAGMLLAVMLNLT